MKEKRTEINKKLKQQQKQNTIIQKQKQEAKSLKQKLKDTTDMLNYQNFLYFTERKRNVKNEIADKIEKLEKLKKELENKVHEHPVKIEAKEKRVAKKQEKEHIQQEKSASKIQKWFRMQHTEKTKYSVNILLYRCHNDIDTKSEEEMKKILETYKRKKIKVFSNIFIIKVVTRYKRQCLHKCQDLHSL